ncbi:MAG: hypothetical protein K6T66_02325 [Peptococcaceae bacterium]|nr:hypothetical protein [Peptococcaceae bacterium]
MAETRAEAALRKLRNRIWLGHVLNSLSFTLLASAAGVLLLVAARHVFVIPHLTGKAAALLAVLWTAGGIWGLAGRPGIRQAALAGDRLGLQDRLATCLEYGSREGVVMEAFREELEDVLAGFSPVRMYRIDFPWRRVLAAVIIFAAAACVFWLPSSRAEEAALREEVNRELRLEAENVALIRIGLEKAAGEEEPAGSFRENAAARLEELENKLEQGYDYRQAALQVADTLQALHRQGRWPDPAGIKGLAGIFAGAGEKAAIAARFLQSGDAGAAARAIESMTFNTDERRVLLENTSRLLEDGNQAGASRQVLKEFKSALEEESLSAGDLSEALSSALSGKKEVAGLKEAETKLQSIKERLLARSGKSFDNSGGAGGDESRREGAAAPWGGENAGRETASARGDFGSQSRRDSGALGGGVSGGGENVKAGREGQVAKSDTPVFAPAADAGLLEVRGEWQENSGQVGERRSDRVLGLAGEAAGYEALYRDFQREGMAYLDRFEIPPGKRSLVLEYFRGLRGDYRGEQ